MNVDRVIATAKRLIAANGEACTWTKPAPEAPGSDPWRDDREGAPEAHNVSIAFFSPKDLGRGSEAFLAAIAGTEVPAGTEIGIMSGGQPFEPLASDELVRSDGKRANITTIDRLAPSGVPLLYFVKVAR